jgi:flavodoxin
MIKRTLGSSGQEVSAIGLRPPMEPHDLGILTRRSLLRSALAVGAAAVAGIGTSGCGASQAAPSSPPTGRDTPMPDTTERTDDRRILIAYYSRAGENYYYGGRRNLEVGNTEVLAGMISQLLGCDVYRIEAADPYSDDYDATVERNVREQNNNARPGIANPRTSISDYDTVLVGSPIWNNRAPMIMSTFMESFDFSGKTLYPFVTYAVSGLGSTERDYAALAPRATIGEGLAVRGEEVQSAQSQAEDWLRRIRLRA